MPSVSTQTTTFLPVCVPVLQRLVLKPRWFKRMAKIHNQAVKNVSKKVSDADKSDKAAALFLNRMQALAIYTAKTSPKKVKRADALAAKKKADELAIKKAAKAEKDAAKAAKGAAKEAKAAAKAVKLATKEAKAAANEAKEQEKADKIAAKEAEELAAKEAEKAAKAKIIQEMEKADKEQDKEDVKAVKEAEKAAKKQEKAAKKAEKAAKKAEKAAVKVVVVEEPVKPVTAYDYTNFNQKDFVAWAKTSSEEKAAAPVAPAAPVYLFYTDKPENERPRDEEPWMIIRDNVKYWTDDGNEQNGPVYENTLDFEGDSTYGKQVGLLKDGVLELFVV